MEAESGHLQYSGPPTEILQPGSAQAHIPSFEDEVFLAHRNMCSNCGGDDRLRIHLVVPLDAGGLKVISNAVVLCRVCEMARSVQAQSRTAGEQRPINFWVSRALFDRVQTFTEFTSLSALVRFLITTYVEDADRFDDLSMYQDRGSDVKVNVWVENELYGTFHDKVRVRGSTVVATLNALLQVYGSEVAPKVNRRLQP